MLPKAARHNRRHENLLIMDPPQLAEYAISRTSGSWMVAGLLLRHNISGRTLAESPEELVDGVTEGLGPQIREEVQKLYVQVGTTSKDQSRRFRSLLEIKGELERFSPGLDFGGAGKPATHEWEEPPFWDFSEGDGDSLTTSEPDTVITQPSSIFSELRDSHVASESSVDAPGGGHYRQGQQTSNDSHSDNDGRNDGGAEGEQPTTTEFPSTTRDEGQFLLERIAAEDAALLVLTGREILAVSVALQFRNARLHATIIPPPTNRDLNRLHSPPKHHAERRTTAVVLTADIRTSSHFAAEIRVKFGDASSVHGDSCRFPSSDHPDGNGPIQRNPTNRRLSVRLSFAVDS